MNLRELVVYGKVPIMTEKEMQFFLTPQASDGKRATMKPETLAKGKINGNLGQQIAHSDVSGSLNPEFVEWLMGFPPGWTDLNA
jgi:hypothetical protein